MGYASHYSERMGDTSGYAHSESEYGGERTSTGKSERAIPVMSPQDFMAMDKGELVCFSLEHKPIRLKSMYARRHPQLMERFGLTPPERAGISPTTASQTEMLSAPKPPPLESWHYDPQLFRKWPQVADERGVREYAQDDDQVNERSLGL
jgi:type IV secretory pathway TraG/TraD family ATPase VirD4